MDKLNQVGDGGDNWGEFPQSPKVELLSGGRNIRLLEDFVYIDPDGRSWSTPKDYEVNGASIPQAFWSFGFGPLEGKYRDASIVHDYACDLQSDPSDDVHLMFYYACRCGEVPEFDAKLLYMAVYWFGPSWMVKEVSSVVMKTRVDSLIQPSKSQQAIPLNVQNEATEDVIRAMKQFLTEGKRSLDEIKLWGKAYGFRPNAS